LPAPWTAVDPLVIAMPCAVVALFVGIWYSRWKNLPAGDAA
jgi:hypothetical protein